ncbi:MAG: UDP-N-acetylmuramoyl-L-alanine--D-glutamate ligase [Candidatus Pacebacteria bacterium]|nr:UDP-N-acetylmuramoyl-L-alanine--D-glutamate ligase [Candidatus Paceibacterota bacterium]
MQHVCDPFRSKHITILGLGLLGRGVGDAEFFAQCGAHVVVTDKKSETDLAESVERLKKFTNIEFHLGGHRPEDFTNSDLVIKASGVPLTSPEIEIAKKNGVQVAMSTALFAKSATELGAEIVGVTGTRGKSTTTQMIYAVLQASGRKVLLGGNVRGISTLALLPEVTNDTICVLELDSWQLQGFGDLHISPNVSVFTNLMPDHQNYYPSMEAYFLDKANIFRYQHEGDTLLIGASIREKVEASHPSIAPQVPQPLPEDWQLQIPGEHNRMNASFAVAALRALGIADDEIKKGLESFEGVEGRLQFVRELDGVKIYNDNNATTPEATIAALKALSHEREKKIILIMGGSDKQLAMNELLYEIAKTCKRVILLAGTGTDRIAPLIADYSIFDDLSAAVREALKSSHAGDVILFSPAFASFGMFKNEYERNDEFLKIVRSL